MKRMIYYAEPKREVLATGYCFGLLYFILNLGFYPTAYIKIPDDLDVNDIDIDVHWGITYSEEHLWITENERIEGKFIGWDYAHCDDYGGYEKLLPEKFRSNGKKWTTKEIYEEVRHACYQIQKMRGELKDELSTNHTRKSNRKRETKI
jgi:hypothetical protein